MKLNELQNQISLSLVYTCTYIAILTLNTCAQYLEQIVSFGSFKKAVRPWTSKKKLSTYSVPKRRQLILLILYIQ